MKISIMLIALLFLIALSACGSDTALPCDVQPHDMGIPAEETAPALPAVSALVHPVEIDEIPFALADLVTYLIFDEDGLAMPEIRALFEDDMTEYESQRIEYERQYGSTAFFPEFYLEVAKFDLTGDGAMDYIVLHPHYERAMAMHSDERFLDVVINNNGELERISAGELFAPGNIAILGTMSNGLHDITINFGRSFYKPVYRFNGAYYEHSLFPFEERVTFDRILSSHQDIELVDNTVVMQYNLRMFYNREVEHRFFIAGLFLTAQRNGAIAEERLWASDENGKPRLFSTEELFWGQVEFRGEHAGGNMPDSSFSDYMIWPDELVIVIYGEIEESGIPEELFEQYA